MKSSFKRIFVGSMLTVMASLLILPAAFAQSSSAEKIQPYIDTIDQAERGMTLWQMITGGGLVMVVLGALSLLALAIIVYEFMALKVSAMAPKKFCDELILKLEKGEFKAAKKQCGTAQPANIIARIAESGLDKIETRPLVSREAMENATRKEIGRLWQNLSYLSDISTIAPLLGLLGTVLGMIQAFSVIAVQSTGVKPILLAAGVSKAMITTAAGLIVAIPVMLFYSYFRGKVQEITSVIETYATDLIKITEEAK